MAGLTCKILPQSPRRDTWIQVFGTDELPIVSPLPVLGTGPDGAEAEFYKIDVARLTDAQRRSMVRFLAARWKIPVDQVVQTMKDPQHGVPILAIDVSVAIDARLFV